MDLTTLIKKGGLVPSMTATAATPATLEENKPVSVAPVATVAVAALSKPHPAMSQNEECRIHVWLAHINETNQDYINDVLNKCRADLNTRQYLLNRAKEVPETSVTFDLISCGDCSHFDRIEHPHLGHCAKGQPEAISGLWDDDKHLCDHYSPLPNQTGEHNV